MTYILIRHIGGFLCAGFLTYLLVPIVRFIAYKWKILDSPDKHLKTHKKQTPYLGGLAIYVGFLATILIFYSSISKIIFLLLGVTLLLLVGLIDDLRVISPLQKLIGATIAALCFLQGGFCLKEHYFIKGFHSILSIGWLLLVINAFNLVDIMDGLATILALSCCGSFLWLSLIEGLYHVSLLLTIFIAPLIVFFFFNKKPATIFLGDAGSLFIGGFIATIPFFFSWNSQGSFYGYLIPLVILGVPLLEVFMLIVIRTVKGLPFYLGSPHHYALYLKRKGWSHLSILTFSLLFSVLLAIVALLFWSGKVALLPLLISLMFLLTGWVYCVFV